MSTGQLIFLVGFSGTGKTSVGRQLARLLAWSFVDSDELIVERSGIGINRIFAEEGEEGFRKREVAAIAECAEREHLVVATGGGAIVEEASRTTMLQRGLVIAIEAQVETIHHRLLEAIGTSQTAEGMPRPLLARGNYSVESIKSLKRDRQWAYALAHHTISTDDMTIDQVAHETLNKWNRFGKPNTWLADPLFAATTTAGPGSYPVFVGWDILEQQLGKRMVDAGMKGKVCVVCDGNVIHPYGRAAQRSVHKAGFEVSLFTLPPGEESKSVATLSAIFEWLSERKLERTDALVAVGGGVVGDVVGLAAATYLRGIKLIQVPTSLTAMVDSSIGGKTAIDLSTGKNLIGAFYHPEFVLADVAALSTLSARALREGWAEAIKTGFALDSSLVQVYEQHGDALRILDPEITISTIRQNAAVKASLVSQDERETSGLRSLLNYGHTIGHGLETAAGYGKYLHGEAVAIGMRGAALIGQALGVTSAELFDRQSAVIDRFGLPKSYVDVSPASILEAMTRDKKVASGQMAWVLLDDVGSSAIHRDVPWELAEQTVRELLF